MKPLIDLSLASNSAGPLSPETVDAIETFLAYPSEQGWQNIHGIIVDRDSSMTIWAAVIDVYPNFPRAGRVTLPGGEVLVPWREVPHPYQVREAIAYATN